MMSLLNPVALWGLLALAIPIMVLFWSKEKQKIVEFGSLEFLDDSESKTARKIYPTQWLLFLLRAAMILFAVFLLAQPVFTSHAVNQRKILIEKEVFEDPTFSNVLSELEEGYEIIEPKSNWLLIKKLNESNDSTIVYSRSYAKDFIGSATPLSNHIQWNIVPHISAENIKDTVNVKYEKFSTSIDSDADGLKWSFEKIENPEIGSFDTIKVNLISSSKRVGELAQIKEILNSYENILPINLEFVSADSKFNIMIDTISNDLVENNLVWSDFDGPLSVTSINESVYEIQGLLNHENLIDSDFPQELAHIFLKDRFRLADLDKITFVPEYLTDTSNGVLQAEMAFEERNYLWWPIILLLIMLERWYSRKSEAL